MMNGLKAKARVQITLTNYTHLIHKLKQMNTEVEDLNPPRMGTCKGERLGAPEGETLPALCKVFMSTLTDTLSINTIWYGEIRELRIE